MDDEEFCYRPRFLSELRLYESVPLIESQKIVAPAVFKVAAVSDRQNISAPVATTDSSFDETRPMSGFLQAAQILTPEGLKDPYKRVLWLRFKMSHPLPPFLPGDAVCLYCENNEEAVRFLSSRLAEAAGESLLKIERTEAAKPNTLDPRLARQLAQGPPIAKPVDLFKRYFNIFYYPSKAHLKQLAAYCGDPREAAILMHLAGPAGSALYVKLAREHVTLLDILATLPSCRPSLEGLMQILPPLHPRPYSLVNAPSIQGPDYSFEIILSLFHYQTPDGLPRRGVASDWLDCISGRLVHSDGLVQYPPGSQAVEGFLREPPAIPNAVRFRLSLDPSTTLYLVCAGTGVAPFIGMLRYRRQQAATGQTHLYYGFRNRSIDFLFKDELAEHLRHGTLTSLNLAVSQEEPAHYVQDVLRLQIDEILKGFLVGSSVLMLCGDQLTMIKETLEMIDTSIQRIYDLGPKESAARMKELGAAGKIIKDVWI